MSSEKSSLNIDKLSVDKIIQHIDAVLKSHPPKLEDIEQIWEELNHAALSFNIGREQIPEEKIFQLLHAYVNLAKQSKNFNRFSFILHTTATLAFYGNLSTLKQDWLPLLIRLGQNATKAISASHCLLLIARLVNEGYLPHASIADKEPLLKQLDSLLQSIQKFPNPKTIAAALFALVLLDASGITLPDSIRKRSKALVEVFTTMLATAKMGEIAPADIHRVVQCLCRVNREEPTGLLLTKFEQLCRPTPQQLQIDVRGWLRHRGLACTCEGRVKDSFCDLVVEHDGKKILIEFDGRHHYDNDKLCNQDQQRDDGDQGLRKDPKVKDIIRIKLFNEKGGNKTKKAIFAELQQELSRRHSIVFHKAQDQKLFSPAPISQSNSYDALYIEEDKEDKKSDLFLPDEDESSLIPTLPDKERKGELPLHMPSMDGESPTSANSVRKKAKKKSNKKEKKQEAQSEDSEILSEEVLLEKIEKTIWSWFDSTQKTGVDRVWFNRLEKIADKDVPLALEMLATCYLKGIKGKGFLIEEDHQKACELMSRAAELGSGSACISMGITYFSGTSVPRNISLCLRYLKKAVSLSHPQGIENLGMIYAKLITEEEEKNNFASAFSLSSKAQNYFKNLLTIASNEDSPSLKPRVENALKRYRAQFIKLIKSSTKFFNNCIAIGDEFAQKKTQ